MPEEEAAEVGEGAAAVIGLQSGESLQDVKRCVLEALGDEAQTQVHGIYKRRNQQPTPSQLSLMTTITISPLVLVQTFLPYMAHE